MENKGGGIIIIFLVLFSFSPLITFSASYFLIKLPFEFGSSFYLSRGYETPSTHINKDKYALDFTKNGCESYNKKVLNIASGLVTKVDTGHVYGENKSYGNQILIEHENNIISRYAHLKDIKVSKGQVVHVGEEIGTMGNTGSVFGRSCQDYPGAHLHFAMYQKLDDGTLIAHKPEPISNYTNLTSGNWYTSDNELYDPNKKPEQQKTQQPQQENQQPQKTPQPSSLKKFLKKLAPEKLIQLLKDILKPKVEAEQNQEITNNEQRTINNEQTPPTNPAPKEKETYTLQIQNKTQEIKTIPNQQINIKLLVTNTGNTTWQKSQISTNVVGGIEPNKQYYHPTWLTSLRPTTLDQPILSPKEQGSFSFIINSPTEIGAHTFRVQIVRQENSTFKFIEPDIATITINVQPEENKTEEQPNPKIETPVSPPSQNTPPKIVENIKNVIENITDQTENIIENIIDFIEKNPFPNFPFPIGGGSGSQEETNEIISTEEDIPEPEEVLPLPEIKITSPTTTPITTTEKTITITGTHNSTTEYIYLNGSPTTTLTINTSTWSIPLTLESNTNTYHFIGYNTDKTIQTPTTTISIIKKEIPIILSAPIITTPTTTTEFFTSSTILNIGGTKEIFADNILIYSNANITTATTTTSTWESPINLNQGENNIEVIAQDNENNKSPSTTIKIILDNQPPTITELTNQIDNNLVTIFHNATDEQSQVANYTIQFWFPEDNRGPEQFCPDEQANTFLPADSLLLLDPSTLIDALSDTPCTWFTLETNNSSTTFSFQDQVATFPLYFRVKAKDTLGNVSPFLYSEEIIIVEPGIPQPSEDDFVVISEIAWMGTNASTNDEWIELYNPTFHDISLEDWQLVWGEKVEGIYEHVIDLSNFIVPADGYVVLERTDQNTIPDYETIGGTYTGSLGNGGEHIILFDQNGFVIDEVNAEDGWFAGDNTTKESMTRVNPVIPGNDADNWCTYSTCQINLQINDPNDLKHDAEGNAILGTPGGPPPLVGFLEF